jgi:uncharacterized protein YajQ (UPF0234 family)
MASFDIVSQVDAQSLDNALNNLRKELQNRYDFRGSKTEVSMDKKTLVITIVTEDDMKMRQIEELLITRAMKQGLDPNCFDASAEQYASGQMIRKEVKVKQGIDKELGKQITKYIKELKVKVQPAIMDDQLRVTGKQIDDLQHVIQQLKAKDFGQPLQFVNFR